MSARLIGEMVWVALSAIWANKLRSFLTILGNVVAIGSIMTLVSLIEGINDEVANVIVNEVGADSFTVERVGLIASFDDVRETSSNPRITLDDQAAIRRFGGDFQAVIAQGQQRGEVRYKGEVLDSVSIQGVTREFSRFPTFDAEYGRLMTPSEISRRQNVALLGADLAERLFGGGDPLDRVIKVQGVHFRVVGVSQPKGSMFGQSQDEFVVIPLGAFQRLFGSRQSLTLMVRPTDPSEIERAMDQATVALRVERRLRPREENNFGMFTSDTVLAIYNQATQGIFAVLVGGRRSGARGRRDRDHEHHADGRVRTYPRDRPAQGAWGKTARHHVADAVGVGRPLAPRRRTRHAGRRHGSAGDRPIRAGSGLCPPVVGAVGTWDDGVRWAVFRSVPSRPSRSTRPDRRARTG